MTIYEHGLLHRLNAVLADENRPHATIPEIIHQTPDHLVQFRHRISCFI